MARIQVNQIQVSDAVVARLRTALSLGERNCYLVVDPLYPGLPPGGDYWVTVSWRDSQFDTSLFDGGGNNQLSEMATLVVTGYCRMGLDSTGHDYKLLTEEARGLLKIKRDILSALSQHDLQVGSDEFLRNLLTPSTSIGPQVVQSPKDRGMLVGMTGVTFECDYDWDLS